MPNWSQFRVEISPFWRRLFVFWEMNLKFMKFHVILKLGFGIHEMEFAYSYSKLLKSVNEFLCKYVI